MARVRKGALSGLVGIAIVTADLCAGCSFGGPDECEQAQAESGTAWAFWDHYVRAGDDDQAMTWARSAMKTIRDHPQCYTVEDVARAKEFLVENGE